MTTAQHQRIKRIFLELCDVAPSHRAALLDAECGDDAALRRAVEQMLAADDDPARLEGGAALRTQIEALLEEQTPAESTAAAPRSLQQHPDRIGAFRIESVLGEGGFGVVYRAEQLHPVRRLVALKVIKRGMDSRQIIARFAAERQALALMDHPSIARIFDAGETDGGQPWFAMELVPGRPVTEFCDERRMPVHERLALFVEICRAVQHAHQKGVIHRDLKPGNILVSDAATERRMDVGMEHAEHAPLGRSVAPSLRLIDFGIARAIDERDHVSQLTREGQLVGTPEYMSPEQARGSADIDTRSDIYALGVLLYQMLTGVTPFARAGPRGSEQLDREPPPPSTRLRSLGERRTRIAEQRDTDARTLGKLLRGDLDCIVSKAIAPERERRYESADALAADVLRYLRDEPIAARPASTAYRFAKFARRNRAALFAVGAVLISLLGGVIGTGVGLLRAQRAAALARDESAVSHAVTEFVTDDLLSAASPEAKGKDVTVRAVLDSAAKRVDDRFAGQPLVEAGVRLAIGGTYRALGLPDAAEPMLTRALEIRTRLLGVEHVDTLAAARSVAQLRILQDRMREAESLLLDVIQRSQRVLGPRDRSTLASITFLCQVYAKQGRLRDAERLHETLIRSQSDALGADHSDVLASRSNLIRILQEDHREDEAALQISATLASQERTLGVDHPHTLFTRGSLAMNLQERGLLAESDAEYSRLLEGMTRTFGARHPYTLFVTGDCALLRERQARLGEAEAMRRNVLDGLEKALGPRHAETTIAREHLGDLLYRTDRWDESEPLYREALAANRREFGLTHAYARATQIRLSRNLLKLGRLGEAEGLALSLVAMAEANCERKLREYQVALALTWLEMGRLDEAEAMLGSVASPRELGQTTLARETAEAMKGLIDLYEQVGRFDEAQRLRGELKAREPSAR